MKNTLLSLLLLVLVGVGIYFILNKSGEDTNITNSSTSIFSNSEINLEFEYPAGSDGYVLKEVGPSGEVANLVDFIVLTSREDASRDVPIGGEGPATISISVYENVEKHWPSIWVMNNPRLSNYELRMGEPVEVSVGGAKAVRYTADGLYASTNVVVTNGDYVYMFTGQYLDRDSKIVFDFEKILASVKFIPRFDSATI